MARLRETRERVRHQILTTGDGGRWRLEIVALSGLGSPGCSLVVLTPIRMPGAEEIRKRFAESQISRRGAEVLASALGGKKACEIADQLGIRSRGQLLSRLAVAVPGAS